MRTAVQRTSEPAGFLGLRLTADEFFDLPDDGCYYELVHGVVCMSPSPTPRHQFVSGEIFKQLVNHVSTHRLGVVLYETDVHVGQDAAGADIVYRPEIVFVRAARVPDIRGRIRLVPDLVVEVISRDSRSLDTRTKREDYERTGVGEYWIIDPTREEFTFLCLKDGRYESVPATADTWESRIVEGFKLDLRPVREAFRSL